MKKKLIILFIMILILIIGLVSYMFIYKNKKMKSIDSKMDLLYEKIKTIDNNKETTLILSFSNGKEKAKVIYEKDSSLGEAMKKIKKKARDLEKTKEYESKWIKLEIIDFEKEIETEEFENSELENVKENSYRKGIIITGNPEIVLTEAELNSNSILDYNDKKIDLKKLNTYVKENKKQELKTIPSKIKTFTTKGYFCDENNRIFEISNNDAYTGRRMHNEVSKEEAKEIVDKASNYLLGMLKDSGEFEYVYYPISEKESETYNILRHAGSVWALMVCEENVDKNKIDIAIDYMNKAILDKDEKTSYIVEQKSDEIKLGGNALATIALCEYTNKYKNEKYIDIIRNLGNGLISMQKEDGGYVHTLNTNDFSVKDEYRTVYYDGEATLALLKAYGITKDEKYLEYAKKSIDYFIEKDYTKYKDHWISYAVNEATNYLDDERYYEFGLKNVSSNFSTIEGKEITSHIDFEMLLQCLELYNKGKEKYENTDTIKNFPYERLIATIKERANFQLNSYMYPEIAMYFNNPDKYVNSFFIRQSNFRIRIDDIQHSILGYKQYIENITEILQKY